MNLKNFELLYQGAEAKLYKGIYLGKTVLAKERFKKCYRHPELDGIITKERMKAESRAIVRCKSAGIRTPTLYLVDYRRRIIILEYFEDCLNMKEYINKYCESESLEELSIQVGKMIGKMHSINVIHGDLTSSNILLVKKKKSEGFILKNLDLVLIDFGLAHIESTTEDKGVDLYVLERALLSTHSVAQDLFKNILEGYASENKKAFKEILIKYDDIRARGRKRTMIG
ncbi:hypothetical protein WA026_001484 [Henosepilachna vigintioctopunctata]|uniref:non-specific serine/threonine protein kinase n=1 Tax=Henosepilachna vigintioctopunctata TaxID=420089 RepID=A0AAW1UQ26_9CUCU